MDIPNFHDRREAVKKHASGSAKVDRGRTPRPSGQVDAVVLHSMGHDWSQYALEHYHGVDCHFAVLRRGAVLWLHGIEDYLHASDGFNRRAIAIEFEGNPVSTRGKAHKEETLGKHEPTLSQIFGGRSLLLNLWRNHGIRYVFAHCQSDRGGRPNCPGPHVWSNVAEYGKRLGLSDGGDGFHIDGGMAIPEGWRDPKWDLTVFGV